ncbi:hypothetical protein [Azospirillum cavernae]|uniref:hypothetical protein n=1 Tax=Azospirillum cavernae TaxID=2320860 RepID=UPI00131447AE|nr:hypothetical protein [Azospirillum cavernae]
MEHNCIFARFCQNHPADAMADWPPSPPHYREVLRMEKILALLILVLEIVKRLLDLLH